MKNFKKLLSLLLTFIMIFGCFSLTAYCENDENIITVKMINYNVAGMPKFDGNGTSNQKAIANYISENGFDIVAVQEDFTYHKTLENNLNDFNYFTNHSGSIPGGDGMNIFTRSMPIYNETRIQWNDAFGDISEGDLLTPKGILYSVIDIGNGVYIDFYDIHADAFGTEGSTLARESNYNQLVNLIEENYAKHNRPVIVTGDFNHYLHTTPDQNSNMYSIFHERCGLKDAWIETNNNGDYFNFSSWFQTGQPYWGVWDSVEKFLYKDGGGVSVEPVDYKYTWVKNSSGENVSDHAAAECTFKFIITDDFFENTDDLNVVEQSIFRNFFNTVKWIFKDLFYILTHFDELIDLIS